MTPSPWEGYDDTERQDDVPTFMRLYLAALHAPMSPDEDVRALVMLKVRLRTLGLDDAEVDEAVALAVDQARERGLL